MDVVLLSKLNYEAGKLRGSLVYLTNIAKKSPFVR